LLIKLLQNKAAIVATVWQKLAISISIISIGKFEETAFTNTEVLYKNHCTCNRRYHSITMQSGIFDLKNNKRMPFKNILQGKCATASSSCLWRLHPTHFSERLQQ